jgi:hypothetical protein
MSEKDNLPEADGTQTEEATKIKVDETNIEVAEEINSTEETTSPQTSVTEEISEELAEPEHIEVEAIETAETESPEEAVSEEIPEELAEPEQIEVEAIETAETESPEAPVAEETSKVVSEPEEFVPEEKIELDPKGVEETKSSEELVIEETPEIISEPEIVNSETKIEAKETTKDMPLNHPKSEETEEDPVDSDHAITEIEETNAKEAEHDNNSESHKDVSKDYHTMSMDELVEELGILVKSDKIQLVKRNVETIKQEFNGKFGALLESKKHEFLEAGGNSIDFKFDFPLKRQFNAFYKEFREKRQKHYKDLESSLKVNLENRLEIIDEIKGLLNVEENINTTYKHFKALQDRWRNAGPIPRDKYNNVWNNYHHHVENFYDFLHLNRDLRDLDFKHNLEQKQKIIIRAEELALDQDSNRAFRELQALHKMWKEELGPVAKEHREEIWERFRIATKSIHDKRQTFFKELDKVYITNLEKKKEIISEIERISKDESNNHSAWQKKIRAVEEQRQQFFKAGKVPIKVNEVTWSQFKEAVREFNRKKNLFYKQLKKEQYDNLQKKLELIKFAEEHKESADFETTTPLMKKVQSDWKKIGHVPRKESDKIWNQFKTACNHYFNKLHEQKNVANSVELEAYEKKNELLSNLKNISFTDDLDANLELIKQEIDNWKSIGRVPYDKRYIEGKFNKTLNGLYNKLEMSKDEVELLKFKSKIDSFVNAENKHLLDNEHNFIRKKIDEIKSEINQLENNLLFFSHVKEDNPVVVDVNKKINREKEGLQVWKKKLRLVKKHY